MNLIDPVKLNTETLHCLLMERFRRHDVLMVFMTNEDNKQQSVAFLDHNTSYCTLIDTEGRGSLIFKARYPKEQVIEIRPGLLEVIKNGVTHKIDSLKLVDIDQNITFSSDSDNGAMCDYQAYLSHFRH